MFIKTMMDEMPPIRTNLKERCEVCNKLVSGTYVKLKYNASATILQQITFVCKKCLES